MAVAFPIAIGLALVLGVFINYSAEAKGNPVLLFTGVAFITLAILINAVAYEKRPREGAGLPVRGYYYRSLQGCLMSFFYRFIAASMDLAEFYSSGGW